MLLIATKNYVSCKLGSGYHFLKLSKFDSSINKIPVMGSSFHPKKIIMNKAKLNFFTFFLISTAFLLSSCQAIAGIFKAGVWVGVVGIVILIVIILWIISKVTKK